MKLTTYTLSLALAAHFALVLTCAAAAPQDAQLLVTGKSISPQGAQTPVGSFPCNMVMSPDGRYLIVTNTGFATFLTVLRSSDGSIADQIPFNDPSTITNDNGRTRQGLYFGIACRKGADGQTTVYASRGGEGVISEFTLSADGKLVATGHYLGAPAGAPAQRPFYAGLAISGDGATIYAADNTGDPAHALRGNLALINTSDGTVRARVDLPGYPFAVAAVTTGPYAGEKVYVSSEQRGTVSDVDPASARDRRDITSGLQPIGLLLNRSQTRLYVANAGSDTVDVIDTSTDRVVSTILVRPDNARGLPGATPSGMALSPDESRLYVALSDMNAVGIVSLTGARPALLGYIPVGWYPTAVAAPGDGRSLFVANAKGVAARTSNAKPTNIYGHIVNYILYLIQGTVAKIDLTSLPSQQMLTAQVLADNGGRPARGPAFENPGIKHVFYIIKENRTYDQVLGDLPQGNGDPSLVLFGKNVTPNEHALAQRFVLLDNFYCCAEVSGDGWNWSTGGMASEYVERNVPQNYAGRGRPYDFEGTNNGVAPDLLGIPDAARPPGGYLWDMAASHHVTFRDYGFFADDLAAPRTSAVGSGGEGQAAPVERNLAGHTDPDFRPFDTRYADSDAYSAEGIPLAPKEVPTYGAHQDISRFDAWKREFDGYVASGNLPSLCMIRFMRDHTAGTTPGAFSSQSMVADNDYAVGQLVETISKSPYWKSSAIVIVEDDAQDGYDHVDVHRSTAYVISPFIRKASHDSRFYNTDSILRTIELLLGLPPMNQYDAIAPSIADLATTPVNASPYDAILPDKAILAQVNTPKSYRAGDSARLLTPDHEESGPDEQLNDILWRSIKHSRPPEKHYGLEVAASRSGDDD